MVQPASSWIWTRFRCEFLRQFHDHGRKLTLSITRSVHSRPPGQVDPLCFRLEATWVKSCLFGTIVNSAGVCGGARLLGNELEFRVTAFCSRWERICLIICGSSILGFRSKMIKPESCLQFWQCRPLITVRISMFVDDVL